MKKIILIAFLFFTSISFSQELKDEVLAPKSALLEATIIQDNNSDKLDINNSPIHTSQPKPLKIEVIVIKSNEEDSNSQTNNKQILSTPEPKKLSKAIEKENKR